MPASQSRSPAAVSCRPPAVTVAGYRLVPGLIGFHRSAGPLQTAANIRRWPSPVPGDGTGRRPLPAANAADCRYSAACCSYSQFRRPGLLLVLLFRLKVPDRAPVPGVHRSSPDARSDCQHHSRGESGADGPLERAEMLDRRGILFGV